MGVAVIAVVLLLGGCTAAYFLKKRAEADSPAGVMRRLQKQLQGTSENARSRYSLGNEALSKSDFLRARDLFVVSLASAPDCTLIEYSLAIAYVGLERRPAALGLCQRVLKKEPKLVPAWITYGVLLLETDRLDEAEKAIREALKLDPALGPSQGVLTQILLRQGRLTEAETLARREAARRPTQSVAWLSLGDVLLERPDAAAQEEALSAYRKAITLQDASYPRRRAGQVLLRLEKAREALAELRQACKLDRQDVAARYLLGRAEMLLAEPAGRRTLADAEALQRDIRELARLKNRIADNPDDAANYVQVGRRLEHSGESLAAVRYYRAAVQLDPDDDGARTALASLESRMMGDSEKQ